MKLRAATEPGSVEIAGSSMPVGQAPLTPRELDAVALWIKKGAPETGFAAEDSSDPADRTLEYAPPTTTGFRPNDEPDLELVTRASRMPEGSSCAPVACVAGKVASACTTNADCDSASGAGDGWCDACAIARGISTEDEMFVLMPWLAKAVAE